MTVVVGDTIFHYNSLYLHGGGGGGALGGGDGGGALGIVGRGGHGASGAAR